MTFPSSPSGERGRNEGLKRLLSRGAEIFGAGTGAAIGLYGGPWATVGGAVVGQSVGALAADFAGRVLSDRETARVGAVLDFAASAITANEVLGKPVRDDGFFGEAWTTGSEVAEGVLLAARGAHEEKKVRYLGNFLAFVACSPEIDVSTANHLVRVVEELSWFDLQVLAIFADPLTYPMPDHETGSRSPSTWLTWTADRTVDRLGTDQTALLDSPFAALGEGEIPRWNLRMSALKLTAGGKLIADALDLRSVPYDELKTVYEAIARAPEK